MATAVLTNIPTTITTFEATTGLTGDTFSLEPDIKKQGSNSVACAQTTNGTNDIIFTKAAGSWDFSSGEHLRLWFNSSALPANGDTLANGGLQIGLGDGTNTDYFNVSGSDVYGGGWDQIVLYTLTTPTVDNAANLAAITEIHYRMNTLTKPRNVPANTWLDAWYFGDGYTVTGGTSGDEIDLSHIAALDKIEAYNIVVAADDVYFCAGELTLGDGISATWFKPVGQKIQFRDLAVSTTLYKIKFFDDASALTNADIVSGAWGAAAAQRYDIDVSVADINAFSMSGVQVAKAGAVTYYSGATISNTVFNDVLTASIANAPSGCTFELGGLITLETGGTLVNSIVSEGTATASVITDDLADVGVGPFTSDGSNHAVELTSIGAGTMTWSAVTSAYVAGATGSPVTPGVSGNEDIYVNVVTASDLTINVAAGATTPSIRVGASFTGDVNVVAGQRTVSFTVSPLPSPDYEWRMYTVTALGSLAGSSEIAGAEFETVAVKTNIYTYTYAINTFVCIQIISNDYVEELDYFELEDNNMSRTINLTVDDND